MYLTASTSSALPSHLVRLLVCALLPACIHQAAAASKTPVTLRRMGMVGSSESATSAPTPASAPYLLVCLPPPLRFAEIVVVSDPIVAPTVAGGPPHPSGIIEEIASANHASALAAGAASVGPVGHENTSPPDSAGTRNTSTDNDPATAGTDTPSSSLPGVSILPDETPRQIRAEDILLYFQFPATAPASGLPPPSSATYQLK